MIEGPALTRLDEVVRVGDYIRQGAQAHPQTLAIVVPELRSRLTYAELDRRVGRAIAILREWGMSDGSRIAYLGKNSDNFYVLLFAAMRTGFVMVPLNWRCVAREIAFFLSDSRAPLLFCDVEFLRVAREAIAELEPTAVPRIIPTEAGDGGGENLRAKLEEAGPTVAESSDDEDAVCLQLYTSGTTGQPKGTLCTRKALTIMRHAEFIAADFPQWMGETTVSAMPHFHIGGISWMLIGLFHRSTCVLTANAAASNLVHLLRVHEASRTFVVPTVVRSIVEAVKTSGEALPKLRMIFYGAAPIGKALLSDAMATLGCQFLQYYGMTEITGSATFLAPQYHDLARPELMNSVGLPFPGVALDIRDANGTSLPANVPGEIWIRTPTIMAGYWNRSEASRNATVDGWYRSGDGGYLDPDGFLYLTDRIKDMIVSGGENVYPIEVEEVLRKFPGILDIAVVGMPDVHWGEAVTAVVECRSGETVDAGALIQFARGQLAAYKCPKRIAFVSTLPRTASGKIQRGKARAALLENSA
jgi:acyl-CoA synthetase (AMP-forming)/AMP-acid ligase II